MSEAVCKSCGTIGNRKTMTPGSIGMELVLWLFFLLPGLIYSFWRHAGRYEGCGACGGRELVPVDSPVGRSMVADGTAAPQAKVENRDGYDY